MRLKAFARVFGRQLATKGSLAQVVTALAIGIPTLLALDQTALHPFVLLTVKVMFYGAVIKLIWDGRLLGWLHVRDRSK